MPAPDADLQSWLIKFFRGNKLFQVSRSQLTLEPAAQLPLIAPWNGLVHFFGPHGAGGGNPFYYRDLFGRVYLIGGAKDGSPGNQIAQLPEGFRPAAQVVVPVLTDVGVGSLGIYSDGYVEFDSAGAPAAVYFNNVSFLAA